jgi:hypothetical protein
LWEIVGQNQQQQQFCAAADVRNVGYQQIDVGISMRLQVDYGGKKSGEKWHP